MVGKVGGQVVVDKQSRQQTSLVGASVAPVKRTPAQAKSQFAVPPDLPTDYQPPEYRTIQGRARIALDIETLDPELLTKGPGAHRKDGKVVGVAIGYGPRDASYYPVAHETGPSLYLEPFFNRLRAEAKEFRGELVGANLQYDLDWLRARHGITFPEAKFRDVQIAEPLLDENRMTYSLDALAADHLSDRKAEETVLEAYGPGWKNNMHLIHPGHLDVYARADVMLPWRIMDKQLVKLEEEGLLELFDLESRLLPLLLEMRSVGVRVDVDKASSVKEQIKEEQKVIEHRLAEMVGFPVDIWSADSIARAFDQMGIEYERTSTGRPSFRKDWLASQSNELAKLIVDAREKDKIAGTFIQSYILDDHIDGRLHCLFHQLRSDESGTVSGRFSSSNPNLQNIPSRHPVLGPLMRSMFIPEEGMHWGSLDWSQIEYRLLVHYAAITRGIDADSAVRAYRENPNTDFHTMASEITGVPRKQAKGINFGVVYGMGVPKLANDLGTTIEEAREIMGMFQENAPFMRGMLERCSAAANARGYIRTLLGRKRRFTDWEVRIRGEKQARIVRDLEEVKGLPVVSSRRAFTHKALNALLQGSAADLMKKAMVDAWEAGIFQVLVPHLTVHDELNQSVPDTKEGRDAFEALREIMETTVKLEIPIRADGSLGANWDEAK